MYTAMRELYTLAETKIFSNIVKNIDFDGKKTLSSVAGMFICDHLIE